ncbi:MAG: hypothetical protein HY986_09465 [Candidatus Melainabacteria bacterium]|nr:hypothetical protein [Candidatus Melainabacteria bacterium]
MTKNPNASNSCTPRKTQVSAAQLRAKCVQYLLNMNDAQFSSWIMTEGALFCLEVLPPTMYALTPRSDGNFELTFHETAGLDDKSD